jgi:hypothetical protein
MRQQIGFVFAEISSTLKAKMRSKSFFGENNSAGRNKEPKKILSQLSREAF